jgi:hypothetical protein
MAWVFNPFTGKLDQAGSGSSGGSQVNSDWNSTSGVSQILNKPSLFSGAYSALTGIPSTFAPSAHTHPATDVTGLATVATTGAYSSLTGLPSLSAVATSGSASDLSTGTLANARLSSTVSLDNIDNNFTAGQTITAAANTSALTASYSVTGANTTPLLNLTGTWNTTGVAQGILLNITDTASNATSKLLDLQVGGTSKASIKKDGTLTIPSFTYNQASLLLGPSNGLSSNGSNTYIIASGGAMSRFESGGVVTGGYFAFANGANSADDIYLYRDAANTLAQRNGTNAQTFRLYNTFTDSSNYERGVFDWTTNTNALTIGTQKAGTGTARRLRINSAEQIDFYCTDTSRMFQISTSAVTCFNQFTFQYYSGAGDPTTATTPWNNGSGYCALWRNTTTGQVRLWANNNGTMVSVALA